MHIKRAEGNGLVEVTEIHFANDLVSRYIILTFVSHYQCRRKRPPSTRVLQFPFSFTFCSRHQSFKGALVSTIVLRSMTYAFVWYPIQATLTFELGRPMMVRPVLVLMTGAGPPCYAFGVSAASQRLSQQFHVALEPFRLSSSIFAIR